MFLVDVLRLLVAMAAAFLLGKVAARLGLPAILGWLIAGMALGPMRWACWGSLCWMPSGIK